MTGRLTTGEVCALARYTRSTLWKRIDAGHMPKPIDRGGSGFLFDTTAVHTALGMYDHEIKIEQTEWDYDPVAYREALSRTVRRGQGKGWRDRPRVLPSAAPASPAGLVGSDPAPQERAAHGGPDQRL
jgi:predicted DNA-binding transcriptional regulator AlpA